MATTGPFLGTSMGIYFAGTLIAHSSDFSVTWNVAEVDITSKDSSGHKNVLGGMRDWSGSGSGITALDSSANWSAIFANYGSRATVNLKFSTNTSGDKYYHGTALMTTGTLTAPMEDKVTFDFSFVGSTVLTESTKT